MTIQVRSSGEQALESGKIQPGTSVTLQAVPAEGYKFKRWVSLNPEFTIPNATSAETTFPMPNLNLKVRADFEADVQPAPTMYDVVIQMGDDDFLVAPTSLAAGDDLIVGAKNTISSEDAPGLPIVNRVSGFSVYTRSAQKISGPHAFGDHVSMPASDIILMPVFDEAFIPQVTIESDTPGMFVVIPGISLSDPVPYVSAGTFELNIPTDYATVTNVDFEGFTNVTYNGNTVIASWNTEDSFSLMRAKIVITVHSNA